MQVNPPPQLKIPPQLAKIQGFSVLFGSLQRTLTQLWLRTGGASDNVQDGIDALVLAKENESKIEGIEDELDSFGVLTETTTSTDYTTVSNNIVVVTGPCTITLNLTPVVGERSLIQLQGNFLVIIVGNINNATKIIMNNAYDLADLRYTSSGWVII